MAEFRLIGFLTYLLLIIFGNILTPSDAYYTIEKRDDVQYLHSCCDRNSLKSNLSCDSSVERSANYLDSLRQLFGHKLNCNNELIQSINVNVTEDAESNYNFLVESDGSGRIFMGGIAYPRDSYCVHDIRNLPHTLSLLICSRGCSEKSLCYKKCCGWHDSYLIDQNGNVGCSSVEPEESNFSQMMATKMPRGNFHSLKFMDDVFYNFRGICGSRPDTIITDFGISEDGLLEIEVAYKTFIHIQNFCVEELLNENATSTLTASVCFSDFLNDFWTYFSRQLIYSSISSVFLAVSLWVFFVIRSDHSIHGWTQFAFLIAAFLFYFTRVIINSIFLYKVSQRDDFQTVAEILEVCSKFFSFGLLTNVVNMNAHLFWTFLKLQPERQLANWEDFRILVNSLIVSWIGAGFLVTVLIIAQCSTEDQAKKTRRVGVAYNVIVVLLWGVTLSLALGTTFILIRGIRNRSSISSSRTSSSTQNVTILVRLFCVTGLVWTLEILEVLVKRDALKRGWLWDTFQFLIYINGVVLFFVYVFNQKTLQSLRKKFPEVYSSLDPEKVNLIPSSSTQKTVMP